MMTLQLVWRDQYFVDGIPFQSNNSDQWSLEMLTSWSRGQATHNKDDTTPQSQEIRFDISVTQ
jgi:hypothetical protein